MPTFWKNIPSSGSEVAMLESGGRKTAALIKKSSLLEGSLSNCDHMV
jgi:hypothetical protein